MLEISSPNFLYQAILEKFKLFQGLREEKEDEKILIEVSSLSLREILAFIDEMIPPSERAEIETEIKRLNPQEALTFLFQRFLNDEITAFRFKTRLLKFLDYLLVKSLIKKWE